MGVHVCVGVQQTAGDLSADVHCGSGNDDADMDTCIKSLEYRCKASKAFSVLGVLGGMLYLAAMTCILVICHHTGSGENKTMVMRK